MLSFWQHSAFISAPLKVQAAAGGLLVFTAFKEAFPGGLRGRAQTCTHQEYGFSTLHYR
jgi:hypothetical protein